MTEARFVARCPRDDSFLIEWCTFPDGRPTVSAQSRGSTWDLSLVGFPHDGRSVADDPLEGEEGHERYEIHCSECVYEIDVTSSTIESMIYPTLMAMHRMGGGTWPHSDLLKFISDTRGRSD